MSEKIWAFWKYSPFPPYIGGEVTRILDDGRVETIQFGKGYSFPPSFFLEEKFAKQLTKELKQIKINRELQIKLIDKEAESAAAWAVRQARSGIETSNYVFDRT